MALPCPRFAASAWIGDETSAVQAVLADFRLELGEMEQSWVIRHAARDSVKRAGNQPDLADAILVLGWLYAVAGDREKAGRFVEDAMGQFEQVGRTERAKTIPNQLRALTERPARERRAA